VSTAPSPEDVRGTRERILEAACVLITAEGIDDVRIARIARVAGVSTALVHYHFDTREALLEEAIVHSFDRVADLRVLESEGLTAPQRLAVMIEQSLPGPGVRDRDWALWMELELRAVRRTEVQPMAARVYERYHHWIEHAVETGLRTGEFAPCDASAVADHVLALIDGLGLRVRLGDPLIDLERARAHIDALVGRDLGLEPGWFAAGVAAATDSQ
jgi:AcrR family transcriptional regulator